MSSFQVNTIVVGVDKVFRCNCNVEDDGKESPKYPERTKIFSKIFFEVKLKILPQEITVRTISNHASHTSFPIKFTYRSIILEFRKLKHKLQITVLTIF